MRAVIQDGYGEPERVLRLEEIPVPPADAGDVLVRVRASSVNTPDWATVTGVPYAGRLASGLRRPKRAVRGSDVAGVAEAVGGAACVDAGFRGNRGGNSAKVTPEGTRSWGSSCCSFLSP
jgi:NADPH:quinone reductase-like Zn-dependent oxidoreductase